MTPSERREPKTISGSRRKRIAAGSGTSAQAVNGLLKQFSQTQKMMKQLEAGDGPLAAMMGQKRKPKPTSKKKRKKKKR